MTINNENVAVNKIIAAVSEMAPQARGMCNDFIIVNVTYLNNSLIVMFAIVMPYARMVALYVDILFILSLLIKYFQFPSVYHTPF